MPLVLPRTCGPHANTRSLAPVTAHAASSNRKKLLYKNHVPLPARCQLQSSSWGNLSRSSSCSRTRPAAVATSEQQELEDTPWSEEDEEAGPAFRDTLQMLEWRRLCEHLSKHASTALGKRMCQQLAVPVAMQTSVRLLQETRWVFWNIWKSCKQVDCLLAGYTTVFSWVVVAAGSACDNADQCAAPAGDHVGLVDIPACRACGSADHYCACRMFVCLPDATQFVPGWL